MKIDGQLTVIGAGGEGNLDNGMRVIVRAGLSGAVAHTVSVVWRITQAAEVTRLAAQLRRLVLHVADAHVLGSLVSCLSEVS